MARKSPQEKKALSYAKDRRNNYGENDKSSRRNIRRNKQTPERAAGRGRSHTQPRFHRDRGAPNTDVRPEPGQDNDTGTRSAYVRP